MRNSKYTILLAAIGLTATAGAQTLEQEVVVDREIVPVVRPVNRPTWVTPEILTPRVEMKRLTLNEYSQAAEITRSLPLLDAVAWADSVMRTPYRGYAAIGYFPVYNLGASAGYRFVNTDRTRVSGRFSYEGATWSGYEGSTGRFSQHRLGIGADAGLKFEPGTLTAGFEYAYSATGTAEYDGAYNRGAQGAHLVNINFGWNPAKTGRFMWNAGLDFGFTGFANNKDQQLSFLPSAVSLDGVSDVTLGLKGGVGYGLGGRNSIVLDVDAQMRHAGDLRFMLPYTLYYGDAFSVGSFGVYDYGSTTTGIIALRPAYRYASGKFALRLGIRADFNVGGYDHEARIAPDVNLQWAPNSKFALYARATGAEVMNTNAQLWQRNPWMTGVFAFERSHVNADIEIGATLGSYRGFWATIHGGWTSVADWLVPVVADGVNTWFTTSSIKGFNYGLELGYSWRDMVSVVGHVNGAQHGYYYRWDDNAKWAFDIAVKVRPVAGLSIDAGYEARVDRFGYLLNAISLPGSTYGEIIDERVSTGDTSNLFLGVGYDVTEQFTVFLKAENLLNKRWDITPGIYSRGTRGLLGVQYKF